MKEQYVGDVNDYRKYALLRHFAIECGLRVGVCWMLTPPDTGNLRHYLLEPQKWRDYDPDLFEQLSRILGREIPNRLSAIESAGIIPHAEFYNATLTDRTDRGEYFATALAQLQETDLIFFDPDNGIAPNQIPKTPRGSSKFIYLSEIIAAYASGHSVLIYQHFPRVPRDQFIGKLGRDLAQACSDGELWCFRTPFAAFLLLIHPDHRTRLNAAADSAPQRWRPRFIQGTRLQDGDGSG
jgi:hypothetical protein